MVQERINKYWTQRANEFSGLRISDFKSDLRPKYTKLIKEHLPNLPEVRALDLGTGAGFFSFILADLGCKVTAIDYSDAMLENAKQNAKDLGFEGIDYQQMDAQNLEFEDKSFDFVFSRNVTWTLPDPQKAYKEVCRVLKSNGCFLNLDANYGKGFKEADERGEAPYHPTQSAEQLRERNDIAKSIYICEKPRPQWDVDVLINFGMKYIEIDLDIEKALCFDCDKDERERLRISGNPLFKVFARK